MTQTTNNVYDRQNPNLPYLYICDASGFSFWRRYLWLSNAYAAGYRFYTSQEKDNHMQSSSQEIEVWADIPAYEGLYKVSTFGRITSKKGLKTLTLNKNGYYKVGLTRDKKRSSHLVHVLVWDTFSDIKSIPFKLTIDHKDDNKSNNHFSNLQLLPNRRNVAKYFKSAHAKKQKSSQYTGVSLNKSNRKWVSQYKIGNRKIYIGSFISEYEAHEAYEKAIANLETMCEVPLLTSSIAPVFVPITLTFKSND